MYINSLKKVALFFTLTIVFPFTNLMAIDGPGNMPGAGRERPARKSRKNTEKQRHLEEELKDKQDQISEMLDTLTEAINGNENIHEEDIQIVQSTLEDSSKYVLRMGKAGQCDFYLLKAWANYYNDDSQSALKDALKAYKADPLNSDAKATVAAMSLINGDYKAFASLKKPAKPAIEKKSTRRGRAARPTRTRRSTSKGKLNFNIEMMHTELLGKTIERNEFLCLSGATFTLPAENSVGCILVWKSDYQAEKKDGKSGRLKLQKSRSADGGLFDPMMGGQGMPGGRTRPRSRSNGNAGNQIEAFKLLFMHYLNNSQIKFAALNIDKQTDKEEIAAYLMENPSLWAQILLADNPDRDMSELHAIKETQPVMIITATDGTICYAGSADSFVPIILLENLKNKIVEADNVIDDDFDKLPQVQETPNKDTIVENENGQEQYGESETLEREMQAQKLYEQANIYYKKGKFIGYGKCVKFAREIIEKYPETQYTEMSREMLRDLPRRKQQQFKITDEELGINN